VRSDQACKLRDGKMNGGAVVVKSVANILERETHTLIEEWLVRVEKELDLAHIPLNRHERTGHLPHLMHDVIKRLRMVAGTKAPVSKAAGQHGDLRRKQGYTVAMMVEESKLLEVSIFTTLHKNVTQLEFSALLPDVVTIADEVDAQLKEQMLRFMAEDTPEKVYSPQTSVKLTVLTQDQVLDEILLDLADEFEAGYGKFRYFKPSSLEEHEQLRGCLSALVVERSLIHFQKSGGYHFTPTGYAKYKPRIDALRTLPNAPISS
jgi:hypothetical protein